MKNKHPYYDSDKKQRKKEFTYKAIAYTFVVMLIVCILSKIMLT